MTLDSAAIIMKSYTILHRWITPSVLKTKEQEGRREKEGKEGRGGKRRQKSKWEQRGRG